MKPKSDAPQTRKNTRPAAQPIRRYPLLLKTVCIILQNVLEGIYLNNPVHMSVGAYSLLPDRNIEKGSSFNGLADRISNYKIVASDAAISSVFINFKAQEKFDVFEEGEFIYTCKTGYFHFNFDKNGALSELFCEFDGKIPPFLPPLVKDFPNSNYLPDETLLNEISTNASVDIDAFLSGLYPWKPVFIEIS